MQDLPDAYRHKQPAYRSPQDQVYKTVTILPVQFSPGMLRDNRRTVFIRKLRKRIDHAAPGLSLVVVLIQDHDITGPVIDFHIRNAVYRFQIILCKISLPERHASLQQLYPHTSS